MELLTHVCSRVLLLHVVYEAMPTLDNVIDDCEWVVERAKEHLNNVTTNMAPGPR